MNYSFDPISSNSFAVSISQAAVRLEQICTSYLEKDSNGDYVIPINRQRPVILMGPAGIGKTDIPRQIAQKLSIGFVSYSITHHTRQSALGLPKIVTKNYGGKETLTTEYTASEIISAVNDAIEFQSQKNGIIFIDEVNCASETLSAPMLQLFQNKTLGASKIPDGWILVMAGNPAEYNKSVKEFDAVTRDRLRVINVMPDSQAWLDYAETKDINEYIISFISSNTNCLHSFDSNTNSIVTPRGWEELSLNLDLYIKRGYEITPSFIYEFIAVPSIATNFYDYYKLVSETISEKEISMILQGEDFDSIITKIHKAKYNVKYILMYLLKKRLHIAATEDENGFNTIMDNIINFIVQAYGDNSEFEMLLSSFLADTDIVTAAIKVHNEKLGKYINELATADDDIRRNLKQV